MFFTRIIYDWIDIVFISRFEGDFAFLELFKKHVYKFVFVVLFILIFLFLLCIKTFNQIVLVQECLYIIFLNGSDNFGSVHSIDSKIHITKYDNLVVIFDGHSSVSQIVDKCSF